VITVLLNYGRTKKEESKRRDRNKYKLTTKQIMMGEKNHASINKRSPYRARDVHSTPSFVCKIL
jgi:hypothetical protein